MYLDRIQGAFASGVKLVCPKCKELLGTLMVYKKENKRWESPFARMTVAGFGVPGVPWHRPAQKAVNLFCYFEVSLWCSIEFCHT